VFSEVQERVRIQFRVVREADEWGEASRQWFDAPHPQPVTLDDEALAGTRRSRRWKRRNRLLQVIDGLRWRTDWRGEGDENCPARGRRCFNERSQRAENAHDDAIKPEAKVRWAPSAAPQYLIGDVTLDVRHRRASFATNAYSSNPVAPRRLIGRPWGSDRFGLVSAPFNT
jgi:hypothetical protein